MRMFEGKIIDDLLQKAEEGRLFWLSNGLCKYKRVVLLFGGKTVEFESDEDTVYITNEDAERLLSLYSLYEFSGNIIVDSLSVPYGRKLQNIVDSGITTEEVLLEEVVFSSLFTP